VFAVHFTAHGPSMSYLRKAKHQTKTLSHFFGILVCCLQVRLVLTTTPYLLSLLLLMLTLFVAFDSDSSSQSHRRCYRFCHCSFFLRLRHQVQACIST